ACGVGPLQLYKALAVVGLPLVVALSWITLQAGPWAAARVNLLKAQAESDARVGTFKAGSFKTIGRNGAFYAEKISPDGTHLENVFAERDQDGELNIITAARGVQETDSRTGHRELVLYDGYRYQGVPGQTNFRKVHFAVHGVAIQPTEPDTRTSSRDVVPTARLWGSHDLRDVAALQWRISVPLTALVLMVLAVPLARTSPRQGRYGKLVTAILVFVIYSNLLGACQVWIEKKALPPVLGLWWVHVLILGAGLLLLARHQGWLARRHGESAA
ncbi:MAG: LPS export ABC transporter permease LptF, partial [Gammaproteobacteria bacterium]